MKARQRGAAATQAAILLWSLLLSLPWHRGGTGWAAEVAGGDSWKAEFQNPGGSVKDRPALRMIQEGLASGELAPGKVTEIRNAAGETTGVNIEPFIVPGKVPLYLEGDAPNHGASDGETIAVRIFADGSGAAFYVPGCAHVETELETRLKGAECLMFDGTVYEDDEMIRAGVGEKTGARMGHIAMAGEKGAIASLAEVPIERRIFVHINNTNPVLDENSPEHAKVRAAGWEIAFDGMEIEL